jgi:hypothetical protein
MESFSVWWRACGLFLDLAPIWNEICSNRMARLFKPRVSNVTHEKPSRQSSARKAQEVPAIPDENPEIADGRPARVGIEA